MSETSDEALEILNQLMSMAKTISEISKKSADDAEEFEAMMSEINKESKHKPVANQQDVLKKLSLDKKSKK